MLAWVLGAGGGDDMSLGCGAAVWGGVWSVDLAWGIVCVVEWEYGWDIGSGVGLGLGVGSGSG